MSMSKPSLKPQRINSMVWYYESKGHIEVYVDIAELNRRGLRSEPWAIRISKKKLATSLRRMGVKP